MSSMERNKGKLIPVIDNPTLDFADVYVYPDGRIDFHTLHYNGGAYWTEVIEEKL